MKKQTNRHAIAPTGKARDSLASISYVLNRYGRIETDTLILLCRMIDKLGRRYDVFSCDEKHGIRNILKIDSGKSNEVDWIEIDNAYSDEKHFEVDVLSGSVVSTVDNDHDAKVTIERIKKKFGI